MSLLRRGRDAQPPLEERVAALAAAEIFAAASPETLRRLASDTERIEVAAGTDVVREGRVPTHFYLVASGILEVVSTGEGEHEPRRVTSLQEGDYFGEIGLLEGMPATATVRAQTACVVHRVGASAFLSAVASAPALAAVLLERVTGGLARTHPTYAPAGATRAASDAGPALREIARLADVVGPALRPPGEAGLLKAISATALTLFDAAACSLALVRPDGSLEFKAASGAGGSAVVGRIVQPGTGIVGAVVTTGETLEIHDVASDERFAAAFAQTTGYRPRRIVAHPMKGARDVVGVIEVLDATAFVTDRDRSLLLLDLFARLGALAIENGRAFSGFGVTLLSSAAAAVQGTPLGEALESAAATSSSEPDAVRLATLVQKVLELQPARRAEVVEGLTALLDAEGRRGS